MNVKILGTACPNCQKLESLTKEIAEELGIDATFQKVTEIDDIINYGVMRTPGLVINEQVKSAGKIPSKEQIKEWLMQEDE